MAARERALHAWDVKALASELARQRYNAGFAGPAAALPPEPVAVGLTSRICAQADIEAPWLRHWCGRLRMVPLYHRKVWEDAFVLQALWEAGAIRPGARALGFAVGREWLPALLAGSGVDVTATDLDPADARARAWIDTDQHAPEALFVPHLVDRAGFEARVRYQPADMTALPATLTQGGFDAVWSVCALEHLGSIEAGERFVLEAIRCLRPGGIAVHTTEHNLDDTGGTLERGPTVLFQRRHLDRLAARLAAAGHELLPLAVPAEGGLFDRYVDLPPYPADPSPLGLPDAPHLRLALDGYPITSVGLIVRAGVS